MPKPYLRPPPHRLWFSRWPYFMFIVREMTSLFIAGFCIFLLTFIYALGEGPEVYNTLIAVLKSTPAIVVHWIVLLFALYHTYTWFDLTPKVMVFWVGEQKIPEWVILGGVYSGWVAVSVIITWIIVYL